MFLMEEKASPNGECFAAIYMRADGLFEGRIHRKLNSDMQTSDAWSDDYEICALTETLPRARTIVYEELGL